MTKEDARYYLTTLWGSDRVNLDERIALEMAIKALREEPCDIINCKVVKALQALEKLQEDCDCISREDALVIIESAYEECKLGYTDYIELYDAVKDTLSVKPQRAKGHLVSNQQGGEVKPFWERYRCSVCGEYAQDNFNYCSRCGAELEGEEE